MTRQKMVELLTDLKENHYVTGVKAEFGSEGSSFFDVEELKKLSDETGLEISLKIGGCEALRDIIDAKTLGVNNIVVPMIESSYATTKFVETVNMAFDKLNNIKTFINIETKLGIDNIEEILTKAQNIYGIVFGRSDLLNSLGIDKTLINSNQIINYAKFVSQISKKYNKELIIGGGISLNSIPFFKSLSENKLDKIETRKIIFNSHHDFENLKTGIQKALDFELLWLKDKKQKSLLDNIRIETLEKRKIFNH